jgi:hypothetical protein
VVNYSCVVGEFGVQDSYPEFPEKTLVVDVDSLFRNRTPYTLAQLAMERCYRLGCRILFWTSRPYTCYAALLDVLQNSLFWDYADPEADQPLLMRQHSPSEHPRVTKLTLLERNLGHLLDSREPLSIVESDQQLAENLRRHIKDRATVHLSPNLWYTLSNFDSAQIEAFLFPNLQVN